MLRLRVVRPFTRPWPPASRLNHSPTEDRPTTSANAESACQPEPSSSILSRSSERAQSRIRRNSAKPKRSNDRIQEGAATAHGTPPPRATSFVSARSAQKRDHAAEKWFTDVRELDISNVDRPDDLKSPPRRKRGSESPKLHEMRPRTDLNALFATSSVCSATSLRIQTEKELGGDYASYLPDGCVDLDRVPVAYARLILGRNKQIPLGAQAGALGVIEKAIHGNSTRQGKQVL